MRDELSNLLNKSTSKEIVLELSTGVGKSKLALEFINKHSSKNILIVVPRLVLINNWKDEIKKWGFEELLNHIVFTTYNSLHKHIDNQWNVICYDEAHHLSERCRESLANFNSKRNILLSATINWGMKDELNEVFDNIYYFTISIFVSQGICMFYHYNIICHMSP